MILNRPALYCKKNKKITEYVTLEPKSIFVFDCLIMRLSVDVYLIFRDLFRVNSNEGLNLSENQKLRMKYYDSIRKNAGKANLTENRRRAFTIQEDVDGESAPLLGGSNSINNETDGFLVSLFFFAVAFATGSLCQLVMPFESGAFININIKCLYLQWDKVTFISSFNF